MYVPTAIAAHPRDEPDAAAAAPPASAPGALEVAGFLGSERSRIIDASVAALRRSGARHYRAADPAEVRGRLERLYDEITAAATDRDLGGIVRWARQLAEARFSAGYDLSEIQVAFNAVEEAIWARVFSELPPERLATALGLVSTILGAAKDALAREYVSLATHARAPSLDLSSLFAGSGGS